MKKVIDKLAIIDEICKELRILEKYNSKVIVSSFNFVKIVV